MKSGMIITSGGALLTVLLPLGSDAARGPQPPSHGDPFVQIFEVLAILLICASAAGLAARKLKQSPVLGELAIGIILGAILYHAGVPSLTIIRHSEQVAAVGQKVFQENHTWPAAVQTVVGEADLPADSAAKLKQVLLSKDFPTYYNLARAILLFSSLGVLLLLFMVGLESSVHEMKGIGSSAAGVAVLGVILPFVLGYVTSLALLPRGTPSSVPVFIGATLCATSIGITARVFEDMNMLKMGEAKIVLGAAVLDDVLGLVVLAIVTGVVTTGSVQFSAIGLIVLKAGLFLAAVIFFGVTLLKRNILFFLKLDESSVRLLYPFALLMSLAWLADFIGLASIVGAFAAGLIIEEGQFLSEKASPRCAPTVESIISPIEHIFAPVFFVIMGMQVDVRTFADLNVLGVGLALTVVAVLGKVAASIAAGKGHDRLTIGIGMVPRGEVGLIFASIGRTLGVLDSRLFSIIIIVVLLTTLLTPPLLTWAIRRKEAV